MATNKNITHFVVCAFLTYWLARTKCNCLPFDNLPLDIASVSKRRLMAAFAAMRDDDLISCYAECDDGIIFERSAQLLAAI